MGNLDSRTGCVSCRVGRRPPGVAPNSRTGCVSCRVGRQRAAGVLSPNPAANAAGSQSFGTVWLLSVVWMVLLTASLHAGGGQPDDKPKRRPNLVVIMTDNHGAWTLGCYGNPDIR